MPIAFPPPPNSDASLHRNKLWPFVDRAVESLCTLLVEQGKVIDRIEDQMIDANTFQITFRIVPAAGLGKDTKK